MRLLILKYKEKGKSQAIVLSRQMYYCYLLIISVGLTSYLVVLSAYFNLSYSYLRIILLHAVLYCFTIDFLAVHPG